MLRLALLSCSKGLRTAALEPAPSAPWTWLAAHFSSTCRQAACDTRQLSTLSQHPALAQPLGSTEQNGSVQAAGQPCVARRNLFIQTQNTPNPASMMFLPGSKVMESGSANFANAREAMASPLAKRLMVLDGVSGVFFGADFVTVTKSESFTWPMLKPDIFAAIMDHFSSGQPLFEEAGAQHADTAIQDDDSDIVAMIKELLETRIRPAVQEDGGDISFTGFDEPSGIVTLKMQGACSGCPSSAVTLKSGIENMLMHYIPEVKQVIEAPPDEAEQAGLSEFQKLEQQLSP